MLLKNRELVAVDANLTDPYIRTDLAMADCDREAWRSEHGQQSEGEVAVNGEE